MISAFVLFVTLISLVPFNVFALEDGNVVNIAMATDDEYVYPTLVSMTSALENKNWDTKLNFYILLSDKVTQENKDYLINLQNKYNNCTVKLIDMQNSYSEVSVVRHLSSAAYYRLRLGSLLPNVDKILYLDGDTIVMKDLQNLYSTDIDDYYVAGALDLDAALIRGDDYVKQIGMKSCDQYINSGVLLMNLSKIREDKLEIKFDDFIAKYHNPENRVGIFHDQDVLNAVCYDKIFVLPLKYNAMEHQLKKFTEGKMTDINVRYSNEEWNTAYSDPVVVHCTLKSWRWLRNLPFKRDWWKYAELSGQFDKIKRKYTYGYRGVYGK